MGVGNDVAHLDFIDKEIAAGVGGGHPVPDMCGEFQRVAEAGVLEFVQLEGENVAGGDAVFEEVAAEERFQEIGLAAAAQACDDLDLAVPHERNEPFQI